MCTTPRGVVQVQGDPAEIACGSRANGARLGGGSRTTATRPLARTGGEGVKDPTMFYPERSERSPQLFLSRDPQVTAEILRCAQDDRRLVMLPGWRTAKLFLLLGGQPT